jgi:serine/threonine protein kinase
MDLKDVKTIIKQLLEALVILHRLGITHGNIVPENIVFDDMGFTRELKLRLMDFSRSKHVLKYGNPDVSTGYEEHLLSIPGVDSIVRYARGRRDPLSIVNPI